METIKQQIIQALDILFDSIKGNENQPKLFVLGCTTSEIQGDQIGQNTSLDIGQTVVETIRDYLAQRQIDLCVQGCEHINRALVIERDVAERYGFEIVTVRPVETAGGGVATAAYELFDEAVVVERVAADAGIDIGLTGLGMHIRQVQIPKHLNVHIGKATTLGFASRPKLIGGLRAQY